MEPTFSKLRAAPQSKGAFAAAVRLYHLEVETAVVTDQRSLLEALEAQGELPGLRLGLSRATRDGARHLEFAQRLLEELGLGGATAR
jgi:hypothetical protein